MSAFETAAVEFLDMKRIAVAGVSRDGQGTGNGIYRALRDRSYEVFPLNPNAEMVEGDPCYPSVGAIPGGVDGMIIVTSPDLTESLMKDCVEAGVSRVWMHDNTLLPSSVSEEAVRYGREHGLTVIDGGCPMMFLDFGHKCFRWVLGTMGRLPAMETPG
jgi:hypothetical protein